ncbi:MAG: hypothetical protein IJP74_05105 [Prevotella sp.]|nr:hypothetical protein [Prevotella sp.]
MKNYISPNIVITRLKVQSLLNNSITSVGGLGGVTKSDTPFDPTQNSVDARRGGSVWDDADY